MAEAGRKRPKKGDEANFEDYEASNSKMLTRTQSISIDTGMN